MTTTPFLLPCASILAALALLCPPALAEKPAKTPWTLPGSEVFDLANAAGEPYRIQLYRPEGPAPEGGFPVLYVLDGERHFPLVSAILLNLTGSRKAMDAAGLEPGIVVAIGYPGESRRAYDYTPPAEKSEPERKPDGTPYPEQKSGGADAFLDFIETVLKPHVAKAHPVDPARQALMGHSYGGLFTMHVLFTRPECFRTYLASSPSLWWNDRHILKKEEGPFVERLGQEPRLLTLVMSVGEFEQSLLKDEISLPAEKQEDAALHRGRRRMVDNSRELSWRLEACREHGLDLSYRIFEGENHGSVVPAAFASALPYAFRKP